MNLSEIKKHKIAISLVFIFMMFTGSALIFITYLHPNESQSIPQQNLQPSPSLQTTQQNPATSPTERPHYDYCMIDEVHPDYLRTIPDLISPNATIVHVN
ncbi:hypothetical protein, partial [Methanoregula sp.]|uniref:hypothetical protein n=1 Tax=Methanoregula sp. TaxID=2052170 RepID=UPI0025F61297